MTDNGDNWTVRNEELWVPHWTEGARRAFMFLLAVAGWASLLAMLWGVLLGWFPQSSWIALLAGGLVFALAGLVGVSSK